MKRPILFATALALFFLCGAIGMMVSASVAHIPLFVLAAVPVLFGVRALARANRRASGQRLRLRPAQPLRPTAR